jgi:hypothetical protein
MDVTKEEDFLNKQEGYNVECILEEENIYPSELNNPIDNFG